MAKQRVKVRGLGPAPTVTPQARPTDTFVQPASQRPDLNNAALGIAGALSKINPALQQFAAQEQQFELAQTEIATSQAAMDKRAEEAIAAKKQAEADKQRAEEAQAMAKAEARRSRTTDFNRFEKLAKEGVIHPTDLPQSRIAYAEQLGRNAANNLRLEIQEAYENSELFRTDDTSDLQEWLVGRQEQFIEENGVTDPFYQNKLVEELEPFFTKLVADHRDRRAVERDEEYFTAFQGNVRAAALNSGETAEDIGGGMQNLLDEAVKDHRFQDKRALNESVVDALVDQASETGDVTFIQAMDRITTGSGKLIDTGYAKSRIVDNLPAIESAADRNARNQQWEARAKLRVLASDGGTALESDVLQTAINDGTINEDEAASLVVQNATARVQHNASNMVKRVKAERSNADTLVQRQLVGHLIDAENTKGLASFPSTVEYELSDGTTYEVDVSDKMIQGAVSDAMNRIAEGKDDQTAFLDQMRFLALNDVTFKPWQTEMNAGFTTANSVELLQAENFEDLPVNLQAGYKRFKALSDVNPSVAAKFVSPDAFEFYQHAYQLQRNGIGSDAKEALLTSHRIMREKKTNPGLSFDLPPRMVDEAVDGIKDTFNFHVPFIGDDEQRTIGPQVREQVAQVASLYWSTGRYDRESAVEAAVAHVEAKAVVVDDRMYVNRVADTPSNINEINSELRSFYASKFGEFEDGGQPEDYGLVPVHDGLWVLADLRTDPPLAVANVGTRSTFTNKELTQLYRQVQDAENKQFFERDFAWAKRNHRSLREIRPGSVGDQLTEFTFNLEKKLGLGPANADIDPSRNPANPFKEADTQHLKDKRDRFELNILGEVDVRTPDVDDIVNRYFSDAFRQITFREFGPRSPQGGAVRKRVRKEVLGIINEKRKELGLPPIQ